MRALAIAPTAGGEAFARDAVDDPLPAVRAEALRALAAIAGERAIERLVVALADQNAGVRQVAAQALGDVGVAAAGPVANALLEGTVDGALAALERIPLNGAAGKLRQFASVAVAQALEDDRLARDIPATDPASTLLRDSLRARAHSRAAEALRASALLGSRAEVAVAVESLSGSDPAQRANALEVIETVGQPELVRPLLKLWDPGERGGDGRVIRDLRHDPDDWIRMCAEAATAASEGGTMTQTLPTLALVERLIILREVPLFAALPPQDLQPIAAIAEEHVFSEGDTIVARGDPGDTLYVIVEGEVRVVGADEEELAVRGPGDVIGEMAVISSRPRIASLIAKSDARVLELHKRPFEAILRERPDTALALMRVLCERLAPEAAVTNA
jgi:HEAT repeat protein